MRMSEAKRKVAALPSGLTAPMILLFLPCLFVVVPGGAITGAVESSACPSREVCWQTTSIRAVPTATAVAAADVSWQVMIAIEERDVRATYSVPFTKVGIKGNSRHYTNA